uniref:Uncharacterized protein n=1 Tax=Triticum urartu TaxID=4572 RepID=A0A8R7V9S2_TRIUA
MLCWLYPLQRHDYQVPKGPKRSTGACNAARKLCVPKPESDAGFIGGFSTKGGFYPYQGMTWQLVCDFLAYIYHNGMACS